MTNRSSDGFVKRVLLRQETIKQFRELDDPTKLVPLAATCLHDLYPEVDKMEILFACREALNRLVDDVIINRKQPIRDIHDAWMKDLKE